MKRMIIYFTALAAIAAIFTGCTASGNVSADPDGKIESSAATTPSITTVESSTAGTVPEGSILPEESNMGDTTAETYATQESTDATRSRKTTR